MGDGIGEIAVGSPMESGETQRWVSNGSVQLVIDQTILPNFDSWQLSARAYCASRMYWVKTGKSNYYSCGTTAFIGRGNKAGEGGWSEGDWLWKTLLTRTVYGKKRNLIDDSMHLNSIIWTAKAFGKVGDGEAFFIAGIRRASKAFPIKMEHGQLQLNGGSVIGNQSLWRIELSWLSDYGMLLARGWTHAWKSSHWYYIGEKEGVKWNRPSIERIVLRRNLKEGHGIVTGDFLGNGTVQIVTGPGRMAPMKLVNSESKLYEPLDDLLTVNSNPLIDKNGMATESLTGSWSEWVTENFDLSCARPSHQQLKIYWESEVILCDGRSWNVGSGEAGSLKVDLMLDKFFIFRILTLAFWLSKKTNEMLQSYLPRNDGPNTTQNYLNAVSRS